MADDWEIISEAEAFGADEWESIGEEEALRPAGRGLIPEFGAAIGRGFIDVGKGVLGLAQTFGTTPGPEQIGGQYMYEKLTAPMEAARQRLAPTETGAAGWAVNVIGQAIPYMASAMVGGYGAGIAGAGLVGFAVEGQNAYDEAIAKGATETQAQTDRMIVGSVNAAIESLQIGRLMKFQKAGKGSLRGFIRAARNKAWSEMRKQGVGFGAEILKTAVEEGLEEALQEGVSIAVPGMARGEWPRRPDGSIDTDALAQRIGGAALGGAVAGGVLGGGGAAVGLGVEAAPPSRARIEATAKAVQASKLSDYEKARVLQDLEGLLPIEERVKPAPTEPIKPKYEYKTKWIEYTPEHGLWAGTKLKKRVTEKIKITEEGLAETKPAEVVKLTEAPGIVQQEQTPQGPFAISESAKRRMETARKFETVLVDLEAKRPELRKATKEAIGEKLQKMKEIFEDPDIADDPEAASRIARGMVKGFAREQIPELTEQISRDEANDLLQAAREANLPRGRLASLMTFFEAIKAGVQPQKSQIEVFDNFFGTKILKQMRKTPQTTWGKIWRGALEPFNFVKAVVCSGDFSAGGIQGLMVLPSHPIIWTKGVTKGYRAFFSPEYVNLTELEMRTNPNYQLIEQFAPNLITEIGSKTKGEEYFTSELAHQIPYVGALVRASDRAFATTLNSIRSNSFYQYMEHNPSATNQQISEILDHIGNLTGRGRGKPGGKFEKYAPELGAITWAPRLYLATIKSVTDVATKPHIRKIAAGDLVRATGFLLGTLALGKLAGWEVELDPRSTDFTKIKVGNTRISFFGRHTQMIRTVAQLMMGQAKATTTGRVHSRKRLNIATRYLRSKLNPAAGTIWDVATGKTFLGEQMRPEPGFTSKYIYEHVTPMFIQDVIDAIRYQGWKTALWTSPLGVHGIGMQTYEIHAGGESARLKDHYAHQYFGADWDQLGPETQQALRESQPMIGLYEDRASRERANYAYENWADEEQREAGRKVLKGLDKNIQRELDRLELPFGGLSRRISSEWYLNDKRYKEYQDKTQKLLDRVLPILIETPAWMDFDSTTQRTMLDQLIKDCKQTVRQQIIDQAKFEDLQKIGF